MKKAEFTWWKDGEFYVGFLNEFPDYGTQGLSFDELQDNLKDLYKDIGSGDIPFVRQVSEGRGIPGEQLELSAPRKAIITLLVESPLDEVTVASDAALGEDWLRDEEDRAWARLQ